MVRQLPSISGLFEIKQARAVQATRPMSTVAFDWLYVLLSLLLTVGVMMDVWSHVEFGPDQSIFNEYHLLFYGSVTAILLLLTGMLWNSMRAGLPLPIALPQGYGMGFLAALAFGAAGVVDLAGHAVFGFESDIEALTSPTHLLLFITWFLILAAPVQAARARQQVTGQHDRFVISLPSQLAYGCMMVCVFIPLMLYLPLGGNPYMLQDLRPDSDFYGWVMGIGGTLLQTAVVMTFVLWLAREKRVPFGGFAVAFGFFGLFLTILDAWQLPWLTFGGFGILLDVAYRLIRPDATRRPRFMLFAFVAATLLWTVGYSVMALYGGGLNAFYYSGYNLLGSVAQAITLGVALGYLLSMPAPRALVVDTEVSHA